jgi:hypothetical protein
MPRPLVDSAAAQVGRVHAGRTRRVDLGHERIGAQETAAAVVGLNRIDSGEIGRACGARHIGIARTVYRDTLANIAAQVGGVHQHRVDHQRFRHIVLGELKRDLASAHGVAAFDPLPVLENDRLPLDQRRAQHQIAAGALRNLTRTFPLDTNLFRIGARRDDPVVFELALIAVEDQIDSRIHSSQRHFAVVSNVGPPLGRIVADEIIADAGLFIQRLDSQLGIRADQLHPLDRSVAPGEYGFVRGHKQRVAGSTG